MSDDGPNLLIIKRSFYNMELRVHSIEMTNNTSCPYQSKTLIHLHFVTCCQYRLGNCIGLWIGKIHIRENLTISSTFFIFRFPWKLPQPSVLGLVVAAAGHTPDYGHRSPWQLPLFSGYEIKTLQGQVLYPLPQCTGSVWLLGADWQVYEKSGQSHRSNWFPWIAWLLWRCSLQAA